MKRRKAVKNSREYMLIGDDMPFSVIEAYKAMRTNLMFVLGARNSKTVLFTSSLTMEGKTNTTANMAITFAQMGAKVLVVDADMRKPRLHRLFNCPMGTGLSEALCGVIEDSSIHNTSIENLYVMTAGHIPPNPADLLMSSNMDALLKTVEGAFDYIFIDAPPVGVVTDAAILANKIGGAILVVRRDQSRIDSVKAARDALVSAGADIMGYVMTDIDEREGVYRRYYGKYSYGITEN